MKLFLSILNTSKLRNFLNFYGKHSSFQLLLEWMIYKPATCEHVFSDITHTYLVCMYITLYTHIPHNIEHGVLYTLFETNRCTCCIFCASSSEYSSHFLLKGYREWGRDFLFIVSIVFYNQTIYQSNDNIIYITMGNQSKYPYYEYLISKF